MTVKRGGLGKGLDSLIPDKKFDKSGNIPHNKENKQIESAAKEKDGQVMMKINDVEPNREQPRKHFEEDALLELADSIKQFGVLQPLIVQKRKDYYEIIAGERRWRAAKLAGVKEVPVIVKNYTDQEILEISLIENIQRENLNPIEEAMAYKKLLNEFNLHTIIRMPHSVFAPYTSITTNILFFDNTHPTEETWFYRLDMPEGYKNFSKTKPM